MGRLTYPLFEGKIVKAQFNPKNTDIMSDALIRLKGQDFLFIFVYFDGTLKMDMYEPCDKNFPSSKLVKEVDLVFRESKDEGEKRAKMQMGKLT